jgi:hypothetical protein
LASIDKLVCSYISILENKISNNYIKKYKEIYRMSKKKPDNVVFSEERGYNASLLPYGTNTSAPAIRMDDVDSWKSRGVNKVNQQLTTKFKELKDEYQKLVQEYQWNELVYKSKFSFEPVIGETYHLFVGRDGGVFLSLISPTEWDREHIGSFRLDSNQKWIKL